MSQQNAAIQKVDEIYNILKGNLRTVISSSLMMVTGICIMMIPLMELIFNHTIDAYLVQTTPYASAIAFAIRTIFYWTFFSGLSYYFKKPEEGNIIHAQLFQIGKWFPLIPVSVGAALGATGNGDLATPIVLVLIGTLFTFFGQFSSKIVTTIAWSIIVVGIIGICVTPYAIAHLWVYLLMYLGFSFICMGQILRYTQNNNHSIQ